MRDYIYWDKYLNELIEDVYPSPPDAIHTRLLHEYMSRWGHYFKGAKNVLDVGCGDGAIAEQFFMGLGIKYVGLSTGSNSSVLESKKDRIVNADFNFLSDFPDESFSMVFSRHSLEHSPAPILSLMEWHRVSAKWLGLIVPNPDDSTYVGRNHYSVANQHQVVWWLRRAGWRVQVARFTEKEFQFVCVKEPRVGYEGYASIPLLTSLHEFERDYLDIYDKDILFTGSF